MTIFNHAPAIVLFCAGILCSVANAQSPPDFTTSPIARLATELESGEFAPFEAGTSDGETSLGQLLAGQRPDGSGAPAIDTWTDSAHWDPSRKQAFFQGLRQSNRFLTYDARANTWREIGLDKDHAPPWFERFGHLYGRTALDWERGHFYRLVGDTLHRYHIDEDRWEVFDRSPIDGYISIDWHRGLDMLVGLSSRELHGFRNGQWTFLGNAEVHGYHSSAKYNPVRGDMLFIGGNYSRNKVDILTADGEVRRMRDAPFEFSISSDNLTHDPITGNYLVLHRSRILWEYAPDRDEWRIARDMRETANDWPFARGGIVPITIDELGVILWNHRRTAMLHRHASAFDLSDETDSLIEREARTMQPGEWRNIAHLTTWPGKEGGRSFKSFQYLSGIDGASGGADGMGWTQNLVYHEGKLMMLLMRDHLERALMVMEADGRFWRINQPEGFDQRSHRRPFNKLTRDDTYLYYSPNIGRENLGRMIRTPLDNPGVFESYGIPIGDSQIQGQFAATYVPEWGRFYAYTPGGKIWSWAEGESAWTRHGEMPRDEHGHRLSGYAGLLLWNPVRRELAIVGGQNFGGSTSTSHKVYRLTEPLGNPEMLEDRRYPDGTLMPWGSGGSKMFYDPRNGDYLVYRIGVFYRNNSAGGTFQVYDDVSEARPFGRYEPYAPLAIVPGRAGEPSDVIVFISHIRGVILHRLKPLPAAALRAPDRQESVRPHQLPQPSEPSGKAPEDRRPLVQEPAIPSPPEPPQTEKSTPRRPPTTAEPDPSTTRDKDSADTSDGSSRSDQDVRVQPARNASALSSTEIRRLRDTRAAATDSAPSRSEEGVQPPRSATELSSTEIRELRDARDD